MQGPNHPELRGWGWGWLGPILHGPFATFGKDFGGGSNCAGDLSTHRKRRADKLKPFRPALRTGPGNGWGLFLSVRRRSVVVIIGVQVGTAGGWPSYCRERCG